MHAYDGLSAFFDFTDKLKLSVGKHESSLITLKILIKGIALFTLHTRCNSNAHNYDVNLICRYYSLAHREFLVILGMLSILVKICSSCINDLSVKALLNTAKKSRVGIGSTVIVSQKNILIVCDGTYNSKSFYVLNRKNTVVFKKNHRGFSHLSAESLMLGTSYDIIWNVIVFAVVRKHTKTKSCFHNALAGFGDFFLGNKSLVKSFLEPLEYESAVEVASVIYSKCGTFLLVVRYLVVSVEISYSAAVGNNVSLESELIAKNFLKQGRASAANLTVSSVISTHNCRGLCVIYTILERPKVCTVKILLRYNRIKAMTKSLRTAMNGIVLNRGIKLAIFSLSLKSLYEGYAHSSCKIRVFTVCFVSSSPSGVAEDVNIGRPIGKSLINFSVAELFILVIFSASLIRNNRCNLIHKVGIKACRHTDSLGEYGSYARTRNTVKTLVPIVMTRNTKSFNRGRIKSHLRHFLLNSHFCYELFSLFFKISHNNLRLSEKNAVQNAFKVFCSSAFCRCGASLFGSVCGKLLKSCISGKNLLSDFSSAKA